MIYRKRIFKIVLSKWRIVSKDANVVLIVMRPLQSKTIIFYLMILGCSITTPLRWYCWQTNWTLSVMYCIRHLSPTILVSHEFWRQIFADAFLFTFSLFKGYGILWIKIAWAINLFWNLMSSKREVSTEI